MHGKAACMVNYINENLDRHIVTVEDPIEYYHPHKKCILNQREVGIDVPSFCRRAPRSVDTHSEVRGVTTL